MTALKTKGKGIKPGMPVRFRKRAKDRSAQELLDQWREANKHKELVVCQKVDKDHVSLTDTETGRLVHFGSTHDSHLIHIGFLEQA